MTNFLIGFGLLYVILAYIVGVDRINKLLAQLIVFIFRQIKNVLVLSGKLLRFTSRVLFQFVRTRRYQNEPRAGSRVNTLSPRYVDSPANPRGDYLDYRGLAMQGELKSLYDGDLSLGRYVNPTGRNGRAIALPSSFLNLGCLVVGPPGSGKTYGVLIPWVESLLRTGSSVVLLDVKSDLTQHFRQYCNTQAIRFFSWSVRDQDSASWNWLTGLTNSSDIEQVCHSILGEARKSDPNQYFFERDYRWLRSIIRVIGTGLSHRATPDMLYSLLADQSALRKFFIQHPSVQANENELADLLTFPSEQYSLAVSGLLNKLVLFSDPEVRRISTTNTLELSTLRQQPTLLVVGASLTDGLRSQILSSIMVNRLMGELVYNHYTENSNAIPLYFMIDEASRIQKRVPVTEILSVMRSSRSGMCLFYQDLAQIEDVNDISVIMTNTQTVVSLRNISRFSAGLLSERFSTRNAQNTISTSNRHSLAILPHSYIKTVQHQQVPVLGMREIMYPPTACGRFCGVVQSSQVSSKPFMVNLDRGT